MKKILIVTLTFCALTPFASAQSFFNPKADSENIFLFALAFQANRPDALASKNQPVDYENTFDLMKDFLDLRIKPEKPMNYWVFQFLGLIKKKGEAKVRELAPFLNEFNTAVRSKQPALLGLAFQHHKDKFGEPELTKYVKNQLEQPNGLIKLNNILKSRLMK